MLRNIVGAVAGREALLSTAKATVRPAALSPAALARLGRAPMPEPDPEPELEPQLSRSVSSRRPELAAQLLAKRQPPFLPPQNGPTGEDDATAGTNGRSVRSHTGVRGQAASPGSIANELRPDASLPTFEDETAQLVGGDPMQGSADVGVAVNVLKFNRKLRHAVAPVTVESAEVVGAELGADLRVEYKIETRFRYDDEREVQGVQITTVYHRWADLTAFYASMRARYASLPELTELDGSDAANAYTNDASAERQENIQQGRRLALTHMLQVVLQAGEEMSRDHELLELLAVRHEQERAGPAMLGPGWSAWPSGRLLPRGLGRKSGAVSVPKRVLEQLEAAQKFRETHEKGDDADADNIVRVLDMWDVYKKNEDQDRQVYCCAALSYVVYWLLLMLQLGKMPNSGGLMKHQEAVVDLVLDEEFPDVSFKKNFHDIMTEDELWQWTDGPLTAAFYPDDTTEEPQPLLYSNVLVGSVQIRQVRVAASECTELISDIDAGAECAPRWAEEYADDAPYGGISNMLYKSTAFNSVLEGPRVFSMSTVGDAASENFGDKGYEFILPRGRTNFTNELRALRESDQPFVDKRTRALSFSFNLLNGNDMAMPPTFGLKDPVFGFRFFAGWSPYDNTGVSHILTAQITFVLDATGHWERVYRVYAMAPMTEYFFGMDWIFWTWVTMWIWILVLDMMRFYNQGFNLFFQSGLDSAWNRFDLLLYIVLGYAFYRAYDVHGFTLDQMELLKHNDDVDKFTDLMPLRTKMNDMSRVLSMISCLSVLRFLKYLNGIEQISFMWRVVGSAKVDLFAFATVFVLLLGAFTLLCTMLWGAAERNFHNIPTAFLSLLRMTVGTLDFDYSIMKEHEPTLAPVFLTLFMFVMMLISINFFIAILTESYSKKKEQVSKYIAYKKAEKQMGQLDSNITRLFPSFTVQEHPSPWPDPETTGARKVSTVAEKKINGPQDAAHIICLHLFKENIGVNATTGRASFRGTQKENVVLERDGEKGRNDLRNDDVTCAAYLQVQQNVGKATHILFELRKDEIIVLKEPGPFGKVIKCKLLHHFTRTREEYQGDVPEKYVDYFANLEVFSVTSWESFDKGPNRISRGTRLTPLASDDWTRADDDALRANSLVMEKWRDPNDVSDEKPLTATELAELLGKSTDAVILRLRLLEHWENAGITEPPKVLSEKIAISKRLMCRLWWRVLLDNSRNECSMSTSLLSITKRIFVCRTGVEQDIDAFFRAKANELQAQCNMRDVEKAKKVFRAANIPVDELTFRMQLYLKLSGRREDQYLNETYTHLDDQRNEHMLWLKMYINEQYADEIKITTQLEDQDGADATAMASSMIDNGVGGFDEEDGDGTPSRLRHASTASAGGGAGDRDGTRGLSLDVEELQALNLGGWDVPRAAYLSPGRRRRATTFVSTVSAFPRRLPHFACAHRIRYGPLTVPPAAYPLTVRRRCACRVRFDSLLLLYRWIWSLKCPQGRA
jgi:hypothetical protein